MTKISFRISKDDFCKIIRRMQAADDLKRKIDNLIFETVEVESDFLSGYGMCVDHSGLVVDCLEMLTYDYAHLISWWVWEADYGRDKDMKMYIDDDEPNLSTPELLYDYLLEDANARSDN